MSAWRRFARAAVLASVAVAVCSSALAQPAAASAATGPTDLYAERFRTVCADCHGTNGRSERPGVPVLAGQPALYAITQLFLFREGRRSNEAMVALARSMTDADLRGFSDHIGTLPPVSSPRPDAPPDAARLGRGQALARQHKCLFCHGDDLAGGQQVPRIGGQKEDYVLATLRAFKAGERPGYTRAMAEALSQVPMDDLDLLAHYVANAAGN